MKKTVVVTIVILTLLISMLPVSTVFAKDGGQHNVGIRNRTGADMTLLLTTANGFHAAMYSFEPGYYNTSISEGWYIFQASTRCGASSGRIFLDKGKAFAFHCDGAVGAQGSVWMKRQSKVSPQ